MSDSTVLLAVFEDIEPASKGIGVLQNLGLSDDQMNVISGIPVKEAILGRPAGRTHVAQIAMGGAVLGLLLGLFLIYGIPYLFPLDAGGQPFYPIPQGLIICFEMTMLGLMGSAFLGMFLDSGFPSYTPKEYVSEISDGRIAVLFHCPSGKQKSFTEALIKAGARSVSPAEARHL
ncbi:MAG TPA: quinol:electron acceptor oxidoreductase subunit ActD [Anaerolineales bacterium]|nr:quinol:electron acceptor oxidoreductase subunit ActD [Anaerolineales bacterium]